MAFNLKNLIFESNEETPKKQQNKETTKFPDSSNQFVAPKNEQNSTFTSTLPGSNPFLDSIAQMYQKGFEGLNMPGYDFFEYFKTVQHGSPDNPQTHQMAFGMGSTMDPTLSKEKLIKDADYYVTEINKVYEGLVAKGNAKKAELATQKQTEAQSLSGELELLKQQMEAITNQFNEAQNKLNAIDSKYQPQLNEADQKLQANDFAKNKIVNEIEKVKQGIIMNLK